MFKMVVFRVATTHGLRATSMRCFSVTQTEPGVCPPQETTDNVKTVVLPNKMVVATLESKSPVSRVSVCFRAGSRDENEDEAGMTHVLRNAAGLGTKGSSAFGIIRNLQKFGGNLTATTDREAVVYTLSAASINMPKCLRFLGEVATRPAFKPWELSDGLPRLRYQLATVPVRARVVDLLHKAAFRTGLGNSIFCPGHLVGKHTSDMMKNYVKRLFVSDRAAVVGAGVSHEELLAFAESLGLECEPHPEEEAEYRGGEIRVDTDSHLVHVAVGADGASLACEREALTFAVLRYAMGAGPRTKHGFGCGSTLATTVALSAGEHPFAVSAFNVSYMDAGLFGLILSCPWEAAYQVVGSAVGQLRCGSVSDACVDRARAQLTADLFLGVEREEHLLEEIGSQALLLGRVQSAENTAAKIASVTNEDVNAAAKKLQSGKLSMVAMGKLSCVPYLDQL